MAQKVDKFDPKVVEMLMSNVKDPKDLFGDNGILHELKAQLCQRILEGELTEHLGYEKHCPQGNNTGNSRNGHYSKTIKSKDGNFSVNMPRDRMGEFEPAFIEKGQTRFDDLDEKIISLYARGMSTRDMQTQLKELYGTDISSTLISHVTNEVIDEVKAWQSRPIEPIYPIVYLDALMIKVRMDKRVINKAFYLALGVNLDGEKELLGIWISQNEGAKFWMNVLTELKHRGLNDIFITCVDGLTGFPEAIATVYPKAQVQLCIVHMIRNNLRFVGYKHKKDVATDLKAIYQAKTVEEAELALKAFSEKWDARFPAISKSWQTHWEQLIPYFSYPDDIRKVIYTTNAIESLNASLRKVIKNKRIFPSDDAALKLLYLALNNIAKKWTIPIRDWKEAMNCFMILFEERLTGLIK